MGFKLAEGIEFQRTTFFAAALCSVRLVSDTLAHLLHYYVLYYGMKNANTPTKFVCPLEISLKWPEIILK